MRWPTWPLGAVLTFAGVPERICEPGAESYVTVKLNCGGAVRRVIKDGKTPVAFTGYRVKPGQFVYSRIDARNGAFAIIPEELGGSVVSKDFPVFDIRADRVDARYLLHFLRAGRLQQQIRASSLGATNRQRIAEERILAFKIPCPPLHEQRRLVAILDRADAMREKRRAAMGLSEGLGQAILLEMFGEPDSLTDMGRSRIGDIADLKGGRNLVADDGQADSPYRVLRISAVTSGRFNPGESKALPPNYTPPDTHLVRPGDLLISRANTAELVGAVAYVKDTPPNLALPDKIWRFVWRDPESVPLYYWALFGTPAVRRKISQLSSGTGGSMKNISKAKLEQLELPVAPVGLQREFAQRLEAIPKLTILEADELFASLQSRAFSGQL